MAEGPEHFNPNGHKNNCFFVALGRLLNMPAPDVCALIGKKEKDYRKGTKDKDEERIMQLFEQSGFKPKVKMVSMKSHERLAVHRNGEIDLKALNRVISRHKLGEGPDEETVVCVCYNRYKRETAEDDFVNPPGHWLNYIRRDAETWEVEDHSTEDMEDSGWEFDAQEEGTNDVVKIVRIIGFAKKKKKKPRVASEAGGSATTT